MISSSDRTGPRSDLLLNGLGNRGSDSRVYEVARSSKDEMRIGSPLVRRVVQACYEVDWQTLRTSCAHAAAASQRPGAGSADLVTARQGRLGVGLG